MAIIGKLEDMTQTWDCVVVGGGAAGLSAALVLGRARKRTLVVDAGRQSNLPTHGIGGLLGHDGRSPADLYTIGRAELARYPSVEVRDGEIVTAEKGFTVTLSDGRQERTRTLLLATGMEYRPPDIPGLAALWGRSAFHCPFCHGWEVRDQPLAVVADGERAVHMSQLLQQWTDDVTLLTNGPTGLDHTQRAVLAASGIPVDERVIDELLSVEGELSAIRFADGGQLPRRGLLVSTTLHQRTDLAAQLGLATAPPGPVVQDAITIDPMQRTSVPGVFAAGDVSTQMPQVAAAVATGSMAATAIVQTLLADRSEENSHAHA